MRISNYLLFLLLSLLIFCQATATFAAATEKHTIVRQENKASHSSGGDKNSHTKFGLVLSGGGARGLAQVGILKAFEEEGIRPDFIVGVSIGSIIGGLYAVGYNAEQLEQAIRELNWSDLLQLSGNADRRILAIDQKPMADRSILTLHLDDLQPVLPTAVSNGQRLLNALNSLVIQGLYHSNNFDSLAIPFRAIATDLNSGRRIVLSNGNLAEALRASSAVPVMYAPVVRDDMLLVDGGLLSNVPVDVAKEADCNFIVAVNTASPLRTSDQINNVLETLDQVFNVMMRIRSEELCRLADLVITPDLGHSAATDFSNPDSLIALGYMEGKKIIPKLKMLLDNRGQQNSAPPSDTTSPTIEYLAHDTEYDNEAVRDSVVLQQKHSSDFDDSESTNLSRLTARRGNEFYSKEELFIRNLRLSGTTLLGTKTTVEIQQRWQHTPLNETTLRQVREDILQSYRQKGYSLAQITGVIVDSATATLSIDVEEGHVHSIRVEGNNKTNIVVILREIPIDIGDVFRIQNIEQGMKNLSSLPLFHSVSFDVGNIEDKPELIIRVEERPSQMLQAGMLVDNERNAQLGLLLRDASVFGSGTELRVSFFSGARNRHYALEYHTNRMFYTPFSLTTEMFYGFRDYNEYDEVNGLPRHRFEREVHSVYRAIGYGAQASVGLYAARFSNISGILRYEQQSIRTTEFRQRDAADISEKHLIVSLGLAATIDTKDRYPFANQGVFFRSDYVSSQSFLGGEIAFSRLRATYEFYLPLWNTTLILHPRLVFGYGDKTMPRYEEFRLGGLSSFIGMRENEFNGRQIAVGSFELRYHLPIDILFDSYLSFRYNLGRTWANPELIRIQDLRHGAGFVLGLDTPIGPALFAVGQSFYPVRNNPETPVKFGPTQLYFSIGVELD